MKLRLSALQLGASPEGKAATLERLLAFEDEIRAAGCRLLVMPEALLGGYPKGQDFGTRVRYRLPHGRQDFAAYFDNAIDVPGAEVEALIGLSARTDTYIVAGVIERGGSSLYCTALSISPKCGLVGKRRKLVPTAAERLIWGQGNAADLGVLPTEFGTVGAAICWENYMPLLRTAMYAKGVSIWCAPTVDDREMWQCTMRHIATEGRCFVVSACQLAPSPADLGCSADGWDPTRPLIRGGSVIVSPLGEVLAGPLYDQEGLVTAEVDTSAIAGARYDFDPVGHYSRPDIFRLTVRRETQGESVVFRDHSSHELSSSERVDDDPG